MRVGNGFRITDKGKAALARAEAELPPTMKTTPVEQSLWKVFSVDGIGGAADRTGLVVLRRNDLTTSGYEALVQPRAVAVDLNQRYGLEGSLVNAQHADVKALLQAMLDCAWRMGLRPTDGPP